MSFQGYFTPSGGVPSLSTYVDGMYWLADDDGEVDGQITRKGARIIARGDFRNLALLVAEVRFVVVNELPSTFYPSTIAPSVVLATSAPSDEIVTQFNASSVTVVRRVDIYELDGVTPFALDVGVESATVSVDMTRSERRNLEIVFDDPSLTYGPGSFYYDKIIKPYRGIYLDDSSIYLVPLGIFHVDSIGRPRFPASLSATCRDQSKPLQNATFVDMNAAGIEWPTGTNVVDLIEEIAYANGVLTVIAESSDDEISGQPVYYDPDAVVWTAIQELAQGISYEAFFDAYGALVVRPWVTPTDGVVSYTFLTEENGNLANWSRTTSDRLMKNDIVVHGENGIFARAENTNDLTPTSINNVGRRTRVIESTFVANDGAALDMAQRFLAVSGLEQYDVTLDSLVVPWLEAGDIVDTYLPDAVPTDPVRFLLTSFSIPLALGTMAASAKRVINLD